MTTNTAGTSAREFTTQQVHYIRKQIGEVAANASGVIGTIPAGSVILKPASGVQVNVVFSGGNPTLDIGISGTANKYMTAGDLDAAIAFVALNQAVSMKVTVDTELTYAITLDTPVAADGDAEIIIAYMPNI